MWGTAENTRLAGLDEIGAVGVGLAHMLSVGVGTYRLANSGLSSFPKEYKHSIGIVLASDGIWRCQKVRATLTLIVREIG